MAELKLTHLGGTVIWLLPLLLGCTEPEQNLLVGTLERERIELQAESNEPVLSRHVQDGQLVDVGDLILKQDPARLQARLDQYQAARDQAAARLAELVRGPRAERLLEAQAKLEAAQAQTSTALSDFERAGEMFERKLSSQAVLDHAEGAWKTSAAEEHAIRQELAALQSGTTLEELQQAQAALQVTSAQVASMEIDLQRSEIRAPVSGRIDKLLYQVGERPAAGATIAVLMADARIYARVYVPEAQRAQITPGTEMLVHLDGVDQTFNGVVRWVSADANFTPYFALTEYDRSRLSYLAEVDLPGSVAEFPSGLPLTVSMKKSVSE
jgi:HlyD family secretion protein